MGFQMRSHPGPVSRCESDSSGGSADGREVARGSHVTGGVDDEQADEILEYLRRIDESINGPRTGQRPAAERSLSDRMDSLSGRMDSLSGRMDSLSDRVERIDTRTGNVEKRLETLDARIGTSASEVPLAQQVDALGSRMGDVQFAIATLAVKTNERFDGLAARSDRLDRKLDRFRTEMVDHMERIHAELAGRVADIESSGPGGRGGSGIAPLAS